MSDVPPSHGVSGMERSFYLLDVFAEGQYAGNQLAVFRNASLLREEEMRRLAQEVHFSRPPSCSRTRCMMAASMSVSSLRRRDTLLGPCGAWRGLDPQRELIRKPIHSIR
jgi:hypothetical protein